MQVTVVGAGVIGLTTALYLEERGVEVTVVAAATGEAITSAIAGAVWFPYQVGPADRVPRWAARTASWLSSLVADRDAGVDVLTGYEIVDGDALPWWAAATAVERAPAPVAGSPMAWKFEAPRAEPARMLPWLEARLKRPVARRVVERLDDEHGDFVIDCTGLAARELASDELIYPLFGQTVICEPGGVDLKMTVTDDRSGGEIFYCIPRRHELVLGGCSRPYPPGAPPEEDPQLTARILDHAARLGLPIGKVLRVRCGLRPYRLAVRLERVGRIVHNYGHGGAGYTLCRGCAEDVYSLITPA